MDDWFGEMVRQLSDDVVGSPQTISKLELTDRVSPGELRNAAVASENELRTQFAERIRAVDDFEDQIAQAEHDALSREWQALQLAEQRVQDAQLRSPAEPGRARRLATKLHLAADATPLGLSLDAARQARAAAQQAYDDAKINRKISELDTIVTLNAGVNEQLSALREAVSAALTLKVNAVIDDRLKASYEKFFSYVGPAVLADPLKPSEQPVGTDAYRKIKYLIDEVGSGTIGVAGPRGSGKSTLLKRFASTTGRRASAGQWGVYVPAPAKYDPRDFLLYLCGRLCLEVLPPDQVRQVESELTSTSPPARRLLPAARVLAFLGAAVLACFALVAGLGTVRLGHGPHAVTDLKIASCLAVVSFLTAGAFLSSFRAKDGLARYLPSYVALLALPLPGLAAITLFLLLLVDGIAPDPAYLAVGGLGAASAVLILVASYVPSWLQRVSRKREASRQAYDNSPERQVNTTARELYAKVKFQQSYTKGWSGTITAGTASLPVQVQGGSSASTAVTPLAMSTPEIVGAINEFTGVLARSRGRLSPTRVVIGIDELDKIEDPSEAQAFFNQIKGLFADDSSALFLVSISDDAMAAFERRGTPFRDAFDSSLSSVVTLSYLSREEARKLIGSRLVGIQEPAADLLFMLAGGLARDLVRLIRRAVEARKPELTTLDELLVALTAAEIDGKKKAVLARARTLEPCPARAKILAWAGRHQAAGDSLGAYLAGLFADAASLIGSACDGAAHQVPDQDRRPADTGSCLARELGVFSLWLVTVAQVFSKCSSTTDFRVGECAVGDKSFERLAEARQNFPLGPDYVLAAVRAFRAAWELADVPSVPEDVILFQYGSNMSVAELESKVSQHAAYAPAATRMEITSLGPARMAGWYFAVDVFSTGHGGLVADIREGSGEDEVWGVAYKLDRRLVVRTDGERSVLDRIEGFRPDRDPENYYRREVAVARGEELITAVTYVGTDDARRRCREDHQDAVVTRAYQDAVLAAAAQANLPVGYQGALREALVAASRSLRQEQRAEVGEVRGQDRAGRDGDRVGHAAGQHDPAGLDGQAAPAQVIGG